MSYSELEKIILTKNPKADLDLLKLAYEFAENAHQGQTRLSGSPYITHPLETAKTLAQIGLDQSSIIAALLHDVPEDTGLPISRIEKEFGGEVAALVSGVTKLGQVKYRGIEKYVENLRAMFVAMAKDIRVILIKFADRLHNLNTLEYLDEEKRRRIGIETLEIYAPIAGRLGISEFKDKLEDAAFKHAMPQEFERTENLMNEHLENRIKALEESKRVLEKVLEDQGINCVFIQGRYKALYSLYKKLLTHGSDITKIHDLVALRVVLETVSDCYAVLGYVHQLWMPLNGRIKDYIANPKPNGYRSIHTTVFGENNIITELQIRTEEMHEQAEYGIAAHWQYKEGGRKLPEKINSWVQELAKWHLEVPDIEQYLETIKIEAFQDRIFVFTPKGDVIDLPEFSTPVDFAYKVHTDLGNRCVGAYVNDHFVALDTKLKSGDMVHIIVDKNRKTPSLDWLKFVKTLHAKNQIRKAHQY